MEGMTRDEAQSAMLSFAMGGWAGLIDKVFDALPPGTHVVSVFQKWGALRFELEPKPSAELEKFLSEIEDESTTLCVVCGAPGTEKYEHGWVNTLCDRPECLKISTNA